MISFGDINKKENKQESENDKVYTVSINGYNMNNYLTPVYNHKRFNVSLTYGEYEGVKKLFSVLRDSLFESITGIGVTEQ